tara:strand:+ start:12796 stop:13332 length:537 start_codon:yes stop_codon:yes gene_type:complete
LNKNDFITQNYIPFQESKISFGLKSFYGLVNNKNEYQKMLFLNNWFSNNLYTSALISLIEDSNDIQLRYNLSLGYTYNMNNYYFKNFVLLLGYNRLRFNNENTDQTNMSYDLLLNVKIKKLWFTFSYGIIDLNDRIEKINLGLMKSIFKNFLISSNLKYSFINEKKIITPFFSIGYKI